LLTIIANKTAYSSMEYKDREGLCVYLSRETD